MKTHTSLVLCALAAALCAGCCLQPPAGALPNTPTTFDSSYEVMADRRSDGEERAALQARRLHETERLRNSDVLFIGEVVAVHPPPGVWSGVLSVTQTVRYRVIEVLRGEVSAAEIEVRHPIVGPPVTEAERPELARAIWRVGARLLIGASRESAVAGAEQGTVIYSARDDQVGPLRGDGPTARALIPSIR